MSQIWPFCQLYRKKMKSYVCCLIILEQSPDSETWITFSMFFDMSLTGLMEFAEVDKAAPSKMGLWKMQDWTYRHDMARVDIAGVDKSARYGKGGHCENGQCGTIWQGWTLQEWTMRHHCGKGGQCRRKNVSKLAQLRRCCTIGLGYIDFVHPRKIEITKQTQISNY